jgi:hypothetical protein
MGTDSADIVVDPAMVEQTRDKLQKALEALQEYPFEVLGTIQPNSFGDNNPAQALSVHHRLAHNVMAETIAGVRTEINAYITALDKAVAVMQSIDDQSAEYVRKQQQLVESLYFLQGNSDGDQANNTARNNQGEGTGN